MINISKQSNTRLLNASFEVLTMLDTAEDTKK